MRVIFNHLRLWVAIARHNLKWLKYKFPYNYIKSHVVHLWDKIYGAQKVKIVMFCGCIHPNSFSQGGGN